ncbi:hypothetical protein P9112_006930 [Eukaryota sp. TZLM1-RC]
MSHFNCGVCSEIMKDPVALSCGHSSCYACISNWIKIKQTCPQCRKRIDPHTLRVNIALRDAINAANAARPVCFECEKASSDVFCANCQKGYCTVLATHKVVPFAEHSHTQHTLSAEGEREKRLLIEKENMQLEALSQATHPNKLHISTSTRQRLRVGVWKRDNHIHSFIQDLENAFRVSHQTFDVTIIPHRSYMRRYSELSDYHVVLMDTEDLQYPSECLNRLVNSGKGLVMFNTFPDKTGFRYQCLKDGEADFIYHDDDDLTDDCDFIEFSSPRDELFAGVDGFAINYYAEGARRVNGRTVASLYGTPLIVKNDISNGGRVVEFNCVSWRRSDVLEYHHYDDTPDASLLFANAIVWASGL